MENPGRAVAGAVTGVTVVNEWKKGRCRPTSGPLRHFHPHRRHQFLEAYQVQHPFEIVGQGRQTPLRPHFYQPLEQKVRVPKPALDPASPEATPRRVVPKGCSAKVFRNLNFSGCAFIRAAIASINPSFSSRVIVRLVPQCGIPRALLLQRAALAATGPVVPQLAPQFIGVELMR